MAKITTTPNPRDNPTINKMVKAMLQRSFAKLKHRNKMMVRAMVKMTANMVGPPCGLGIGT